MNKEQLWERFATSGKITDYLRYIKESENDNT